VYSCVNIVVFPLLASSSYACVDSAAGVVRCCPFRVVGLGWVGWVVEGLGAGLLGMDGWGKLGVGSLGSMGWERGRTPGLWGGRLGVGAGCVVSMSL
jgi:hypothetical protein